MHAQAEFGLKKRVNGVLLVSGLWSLGFSGARPSPAPVCLLRRGGDGNGI